jgi:hypothetical protein
MNCNLVAENKMIKSKIGDIEDEVMELRENVSEKKIKESMNLTYEEK